MFNLKLLALIFSALIVGSPFTPQKQSCCEIPATGLFANLANDMAFVAKHENPIPFVFQSKAGGQVITFDVADGKKANAYQIKATQKTKQVLFVFHEWWGLNDYVKQEAENYYNALGGKVNVLAIDLYDGLIATTREDAAKYMQGVNNDRAAAIVTGAVKYMNDQKVNKIATVGWCFGGGWSLQASLIAAKQAKACVMYYGMPEKDEKKLEKLNSNVLGIFATEDKWISTEVAKEFEQTMLKAKKKVTIKSFEADHAFANPSNPKYNKAFADEAFAMSIAFIKKNL
jgi:carboxymethylenebutenolidase